MTKLQRMSYCRNLLFINLLNKFGFYAILLKNKTKRDVIMPSCIDKEKTKKTVSLILEKVANEADLQLLSEYNSLFKKEVSFFRRSWAAAYLLMLCDQGKLHIPGAGKAAHRKAKGERFSNGDSNTSGVASSGAAGNGVASTEGTQRYPLSDEESVKLFFSAGRSRRIFPREILGIINTKTAIAKEDIGAIRILDNYSFVQVRDTVAPKIIEALNGVSFRGRALTVNYAKSRKNGEDENDLAENEESSSPSFEYIDEENDPPKTHEPELEQDSEQAQDYTDEEDI